MQTICREVVNQHIRALGLRSLQETLRSGGNSTEMLGKMAADRALAILLEPTFRLQVALATIQSGGRLPMPLLDNLAILARTHRSESGPTIITLDRETLSAFRSTDLNAARCAERVLVAWQAGISLIEALGAPWLCRVASAVDIVAGIDGEADEVRSFSNPLFPGFAAINVNAPPVLIAEMIIHEAMHSVVSALLAVRSEFQQFASARAGILSPFADSVRPHGLVLHGIISYGCVRNFWVCCKEVRGQVDEDVSDRRVQLLTARVCLGVRLLSDGMPDLDIAQVIRDATLALGTDLNWALSDDRSYYELITDAGYDLRLALSPIQMAEFALARHGTKTSRLSMALRDVSLHGFALAARIPIACSAEAFSAVADERLNGFSNVAEALPLLDAQPQDEVHFYLADDVGKCVIAAELDQRNRAGGLFGIPECCQDWFATHWVDIHGAGGDGFAYMLNRNAKGSEIQVAEECDASSMYRSGGLCWHFPCSPHCARTIEVVQARRETLGGLDPATLILLDRAKRKDIGLRSDGAYVSLQNAGPGVLRITFVVSR